MDQANNLLFVVLHRPESFADQLAYSFLPSEEFEGANKDNTVWREDWKQICNVSSIKCLTIIRPPGEIRVAGEWETLYRSFDSNTLDKLNYVWVTEQGRKFEPTIANNNVKYEGMILKISFLKFKSARFEALPPWSYFTYDPSIESLRLSKVTENVELHDIYADKVVFFMPQEGSSLSNMKVTGDTASIEELVFTGMGNTGRESIENRIRNKKQGLKITIEEKTVMLNSSYMKWYGDGNFKGAMFLSFGDLLALDGILVGGHIGYQSEEATCSSCLCCVAEPSYHHHHGDAGCNGCACDGDGGGCDGGGCDGGGCDGGGCDGGGCDGGGCDGGGCDGGGGCSTM